MAGLVGLFRYFFRWMRFELELMVKYSLLPLPYFPELPLMLSIGVIRAMVVFPQSQHYPPQRGGTLVTAGRRPADIQSSTINHQSSTPSLLLIRLLKGSSMSPHRSSSRAMVLLRNHAAKLLPFRHVWISCPELREGQKNLYILQFTDDRICP